MKKFINFIAWHIKIIKDNMIVRISFYTLLVIIFGGFSGYMLERNVENGIHSFGDAIWWAIVTITTIGYGDITPASTAGRIVAVVVMLFGLVFTSVLFGSIASILVEKRLKEGKGLKEVKTRDHIIICGWNENTIEMIENLVHLKGEQELDIVIVNELDEDSVNEIKLRFHKQKIRIQFVRGKFTDEHILRRANITKAKSVVIVPDRSGEQGFANADERTILAAFTVKSIVPDISLTAEIINKENEGHLIRAGVDNILISDEFADFLLSNAAVFPAMPELVKKLLDYRNDKTLNYEDIPRGFIGKPYKELFDTLKQKGSLAIGIVKIEKEMSIDDILADDSSGIDAFIKRKFMEAEQDFFEGKKRFNIKIFPPDDYIIEDNDSVFVIK